jgi:hypothetical protein
MFPALPGQDSGRPHARVLRGKKAIVFVTRMHVRELAWPAFSEQSRSSPPLAILSIWEPIHE